MSPCIIDSGASDYMIGDATIFQNYTPCFEYYMVRIADGSFSKVVGTNFVVISKDLMLDSVLLVPNLDCNLLSIRKLTQENIVLLNFFQTIVFFRI